MRADEYVHEHWRYVNYLWLAWNRIHTNVEEGIFDYETKTLARSLLSVGSKSRFLQRLANGNLWYPKEVIESALEFERMDRLEREDYDENN